MKILSVLFCIIILMACSNTTHKKKTTRKIAVTKTHIKFNNKIHDFKNLTEGETVGCYFHYKNTGKSPLILNKVKPGCGCTTAKYTNKPILPGAEGDIEIRFNTAGFSGKQYKVIKVVANIPKSIDLVIAANVINPN